MPALAVGVAACGDDEKDDAGSGGRHHRLDQPDDLLLAAPAGHVAWTVRGRHQRREARPRRGRRGKVGKFTIKYVSLDDSTAQNPGTADEGKTAQNARQAIRDKSTIFYLGEFNSGGTKVSLPILNKAGIPQISPSNTYIGLTTDEPGSEPGEPDKYYPTGNRTYARVVPRDKIQGAALVTVMKEDGCKTVTLWNDKSTYGAGLARNIKQSAETEGLTIENEEGTDKNSPNYRSIASKIKSDCFVFSGVTGENGVQVLQGRRQGGPERQALRPRRRDRGGVLEPEGGRHPRLRRQLARRRRSRRSASRTCPAAEPILEKYKAKYKTRDGRPVRDLRLRDDGPGPRRAQARR